MTKPVTCSKKPRKWHTPEFRQETLKLAERIGAAAAARKLGLHESQLYAWRSKQHYQNSSSEREQEMSAEIARFKHRVTVRRQFRQDCDTAVRNAFRQAKQRCGAPRLTDELRARGQVFTVKTVAPSLRRQGLQARAARKFSLVSYRKHGLPVSENLLKQDFSRFSRLRGTN